jgi:alkyl hydroperoxide reductase subunit AhpC
MDEKQYPNSFGATRDDHAPLFLADAVDGNVMREINLDEYKGRWVLLFFYPSDFTPV